jgi:hypothetical protein
MGQSSTYFTQRQRQTRVHKWHKAKTNNTIEAEEWELQDSVIMSWLLHSMEPNISEHFCYKETSKIMWDEVQNRFGKQNNYAHIYQLREELTHNKQNQRPFSQLYSEMQKKWDELDILQPNTSDLNQI